MYFPLLLFLLLFPCALACGSIEICPEAVWSALLGSGGDEAVAYVVREVRLPAACAAALSGAALAASGLTMQTVFANPLADPSLLGVNAGAGLGAAIALLVLGGGAGIGALSVAGYLFTAGAALCGGLLAIALLTLCAIALPGRLQLLVSGVMISFAAGAIISVLSFYATAQGVRSYVVWGLGDFSGLSLARLPLFAALVGSGLLLLLLHVKALNAFLLGNQYAQSLGVRVQRARTLLLLGSGILAAAVTALCGPIAFLGLAAPHIARRTARTADHRRLLPAAVLWGADLALLALIASTLPQRGSALPINALTPIVGVPIVFYLLLRKPRH